jgi:hypothetical protein
MFGYGVVCNRTYHRKTVLGIHISEERNMFVAGKKIYLNPCLQIWETCNLYIDGGLG